MPAKKNKSKKTFLTWKNLSLSLIALIIISVLACVSGIPKQIYKEKTLKKFYENLVEAEKNSDVKAIYDALTYEQRRIMPLEELIKEKDADRKPISMDFTIHSYKVDDDRGLIDRTLIACFTEDCTNEDRFEQRAVKEYLYINGKWYVPSENDTNEEGEVIDQNWPTLAPNR